MVSASLLTFTGCSGAVTKESFGREWRMRLGQFCWCSRLFAESRADIEHVFLIHFSHSTHMSGFFSTWSGQPGTGGACSCFCRVCIRAACAVYASGHCAQHLQCVLGFPRPPSHPPFVGGSCFTRVAFLGGLWVGASLQHQRGSFTKSPTSERERERERERTD